MAEIGPAAAACSSGRGGPGDRRPAGAQRQQRIARAWEVWRGTGRAWRRWRGGRIGPAPAPWRFAAVLLEPPRQDLRAAIARRFDAMLSAGAATEVQALLALGLDRSLPAMRAHGVPELSAHLRGEITLEEAARRAVLATGQYAKRQATWFRHHPLAGYVCKITAEYHRSEKFSEKNAPIYSICSRHGLTRRHQRA